MLENQSLEVYFSIQSFIDGNASSASTGNQRLGHLLGHCLTQMNVTIYRSRAYIAQQAILYFGLWNIAFAY